MADPTREDVLAWMAAHAKGYKLAAKHFGLPVGRVKKWQQRAKKAALNSGGDTGGHLIVLPTPTPSPPKQPAGGQRGTPPPTKVSRNGRVTLSADALDEESAGLLRKAALRCLLYAAGEPMPELGELTLPQLAALEAVGLTSDQLKALDALSTWDPRKVKESMVALGIIVDKCPDILSLGKKTAEKTTNGKADAGSTADAVAKAMGLD